MTINDVVAHLGVSWDVIKDIQKCNLHRRFAKPKHSKLKGIAIDKISLGKGHRYLTIVLDLSTGAVVFVGDGKGGDALEPFWERLKRSKARKIKAVKRQAYGDRDIEFFKLKILGLHETRYVLVG